MTNSAQIKCSNLLHNKKSYKFKQLIIHSTALISALAFANIANANSVSINGGTPTTTSGTISVVAPASNANVVVDTSDINGYIYVDTDTGATQNIQVNAGRTVNNTGGYAIWGIAKTSDISAVINGSLIASGNGLTLDSRFGPDGGSVSASGSGSVTANGYAIWLLSDTLSGNVTLDGFAGGINGGAAGVLVNSNGTYSNHAGGTVNIGVNQRLGNVVATAGRGIDVIQQANSNGDGKVNIYASNVTSTDFGVHVQAWTNSTLVDLSGALSAKGATGVYITSIAGAIEVRGNGTATVNGGDKGIHADSGGNGNINIHDFASVTGKTTGIIAETNDGGAGNVTIANVGNVTGTGDDGIYATTSAGTIDISGAKVTSSDEGIFADSGANGNINIHDLSGVTAGDIGIMALSNDGGAGNITITNTGAIKSGGEGIHTEAYAGNTEISGTTIDSGDDGVRADAAGNGNINIHGFTSIIAGDDGIVAETNDGGAGTVTIANNGTIKGNAGFGIYSTTTNGTVSIQGNGKTGGISGTDEDGIYVATVKGNVNVGNIAANGNISGKDDAIDIESAGGAINIQGAGTTLSGTNGDGIYAKTSGANINIGDSGTFGAITAGYDGIEAYNSGTGANTIKTGANVTAAAWGIYSETQNGANNVTVAGGNVIGQTRGIEVKATGSGNITTNIASGSTIAGNDYGYVVSTASGNSVTNNKGLITALNAATDTGGDAVLMASGTNTMNNSGTISGRFHTGGAASTYNNLAGGVWNPGNGANNFATAADVVNNSGTINIRAGSTTFAGLETFNNQSGGLIDMTVSSAVTDDLTVYNFSPLAGSRIKVNFDASAVKGIGDAVDVGNADTITVTNKVTASGLSYLDVIATGGTNNAGEPAALTGSVAIIYNGTTLAAPTAGQQLVASDNFTFGTGNPSTAKRKFTLVEDSNGGLFMQWQPNITSATMGAFLGGDMSDAKGSGLGAASGASSGIIGGNGVNSMLADMSSGAANGQCAGGKDGAQIWAHTSGGSSDYKNSSANGNDWSGAIGWEHKIDFSGKDSCGRSAIGYFAFMGNSTTKSVSSKTELKNGGVGIYYRRANENGFYVNALAAVSSGDNDVVNKIFASTASYNSLTLIGDLTGGYAKGVSDKDMLDLRASASIADSDSGKFHDSVGFEVDDISQKVKTIAANVGLIHQMNIAGGDGSFYGRIGVKYSDLDSSVLTYGIKTSGSGAETFATLDTGLSAKTGNNTYFGVGAYGDFSSDTTRYGAKISLRHMW